MRKNLRRNQLVFTAVFFSFAWNIFLLVGVILNIGFAHTRAAGGQFTDFPTAIRVVYALQLALVIYQFWIFKVISRVEPMRFRWLPRLFVVLGIIGILLNALSRSSNERWNVIPGALITWAFWYYGVKKKSFESTI